MNTLRIFALASVLLLFGPFGSHGAFAASIYLTNSDGRLLTGELVVTNGSRNQFRLVGHGGSYTAPAGIAVEAWDGKPVQVAFSRDGRVLQISELPVHITPNTHGFDIVSGELVAWDPALRTFMIAGDDHIYRAPAGIEVGPYSGRMVEVRLNEDGQVIEMVPSGRSGDAPVVKSCIIDGHEYANGSSFCQSGTQYRCDFGQWRNLGTECVSNTAAGNHPERTCLVDGATTVANGSSICRSGTTYRCTDGEWRNILTACR